MSAVGHGMPKEVEDAARKELRRLQRMPEAAAEYGMVRLCGLCRSRAGNWELGHQGGLRNRPRRPRGYYHL
jgi:hypothetical protein